MGHNRAGVRQRARLKRRRREELRLATKTASGEEKKTASKAGK